MLSFTYRLYHKPTEKNYYGCRYAKNCHPNDLLTTYFTSSKIVKSLIKEFGLDSFVIKRIKLFDSKEKAQYWEHKFLKRVNAAKNDKWINLHNGANEFVCLGHKEETKKKMSISHLGLNKNFIMSEKQKEKLRIAALGRPSGFKGKKHSDLSIEKNRIAHLGKDSGYHQGMKGRKHTEETKAKISRSKRIKHLEKCFITEESLKNSELY